MTSNTEKKEQSLAEFLLIVVLVGVLMAFFIQFYFKNEPQFSRAGLETIAQKFRTTVNTVHAQWMMDNQPNIVYLASLKKLEKQPISVNKLGWVDVKQETGTCEAIWLLVMEIPLNSMKVHVSAIEVLNLNQSKLTQVEVKQNNITHSACRYIIRDGSYFQYNRTNGQVSKVI